MLVNVLFPPAVRTPHAGQAVQRLAEEIAALLEEAAQGLGSPSAGRSTGPLIDSGNFFPTGTGWFSIPSVDRSSGDFGLTPDATARWLDDARRLNRHVPRVDRALTHAEESRRLNVRALGTPQSARSLRGGLEALELCSIAVRSLFRSIDDWVRGGMPEPDTPYADRARTAWAELLADLAVVVRAFGALLRAEAEGGDDRAGGRRWPTPWTGCASTGVRHAEALLADPREHPDLWEVDGAVAGLVDRMLLELDTAAHAQLWQDRRPREIIDLHIATELLDRLRPARRPGGERPRAAPADGRPTADGSTAGPADRPAAPRPRAPRRPAGPDDR